MTWLQRLKNNFNFANALKAPFVQYNNALRAYLKFLIGFGAQVNYNLSKNNTKI
jgi:hypothetical protein